jgi:hypothetical protein
VRGTASIRSAPAGFHAGEAPIGIVLARWRAGNGGVRENRVDAPETRPQRPSGRLKRPGSRGVIELITKG